MIATCTACQGLYETTTEDAGDPGRLCVRCYHEEQANREDRARTRAALADARTGALDGDLP